MSARLSPFSRRPTSLPRLLKRSVPLALIVVVLGSLLPALPAAVAQDAAGDPTLQIVQELEARRGERSKIFLNSDGSHTGRFFTEPVHYQSQDGSWLDIDTTVVASDRAGYAWRNTAGSFQVHFSATADEDEMVSVTDATSSVTFGFQGVDPASTAVVEGSKITYPSVKPGMDLVYEVRDGEVKEFLVLQEAPQQQLDLRFPLTLSNLTAEEAASGAVDLVTSTGNVGFYMSDLWMMDSARDVSSDEPGFSENVAATLSGPSSAPTLTVTPDHAWLTSPERVYPVTIDPTITKETTDDTYVQSNILNTDVSGENEMKSGTYDGGTTKARSLLKFADVQSQIPNGATITGARMYVWESHSYSCTPRDVSAHRITDSWDGNAVRWSTQPGVAAAATTVNVAKGYSSSCGAGWVEFPNLGGMVDYWKTVGNNFGIEIRSPNETTSDWWKKWHATGSGNRPYLEVFYSEPDTIPPDVTNLSSSTHPVEGAWYSRTDASFSWSGSDASGIAGYSYLRDQSSGTTPDNVTEGTGTSASYSGLAQGTHYFHVRAKDNAGNWGTAKHYAFGIDTGAPSDPSISSSSHTRDACSTNRNATFSWSSSDATSGLAGYGYIFDQSPTTTPGTSVVSGTTSGTFSGSTDGDWWMHARAKDNAGNLSGSSHFKVRINADVPSAPALSSSSHSSGVWSTNSNFSASWSLSDYFGITGYSYILDQSSNTIPDSSSEGVGTSYTTSGLGDGTHYFHVRGLDGCGSWGDTQHFMIRVDGTQSSAPVVNSSSHPSDSTWYSSRSPSFNFLVTDTSGIDGYSHLIDGSSLTTPDTVAEGASSTYNATGLGDGTHYFHVRARNGSGLWSDPGHRAVKIDGTAPAEPAVSSSTHPVAATDYASNDPALSWTAPSDLSGIAGYSYVLDQALTTTPDTTSEGTFTTKSYTDLADGTYYFHVRARDVAGNWGAATHRRIGVLVPAPAVSPTLTAPAGQIDPDGKPVVKNGDLLTFGGDITEGSGAGAPLDTAATITTCDLVVSNEAGTVTSRIAVPLTSCKNVGGKLTGSYAPANLGVTMGTVKLEVIAQRTEAAVTKTSGTQASNSLQVDNDAPRVAAAPLGCLLDTVGACDESRTVLVELSELVQGDFIAADFAVAGNTVVRADSTCAASASCEEVVLTTLQPIDRVNPPRVSYSFFETIGRARPADGAKNWLSASGGTAQDVDGTNHLVVDGAATVQPEDGLAPTVLQTTPEGVVLTLDDNILQIYADNADADCPSKFVDEAAFREKACDPVGRELRLAQRVVSLATKPVDSDDGMAYAPDVLLLQETRVSDAENIAGHLNELIQVGATSCAVESTLIPKCYRVAVGSTKLELGQTDQRVFQADTAIVYNARSMTFVEQAPFWTTYSREEKCKPTKNALGDVVFIDEDFDGFNDCGKKRIVKKHFMASFTEQVPLPLTVAVASVHFITPSHLAGTAASESIHGDVKERWARKAADKLAAFSPAATFYQIAGDFNIKRCLTPSTAVLKEPIDPQLCGERKWWQALVGSLLEEGEGYKDAIYQANSTDAEMNQQYENGEGESDKRIDFIFTRSTTGSDPLAASRDFTCGKGDTDLATTPERQTCEWLENKERYSDHNLLWVQATR